MFEGWSEFYIMIGGASAGLIGLLFVVVTLSAANEADDHSDDLLRGHSVYATPTFFHLAVVMLTSATALAPGLPAPFYGIVIFVCGLAGLCYSAWVMMQFKSLDPPPGFEGADLWLYGVGPALIYLGFLLVGGAVAFKSSLAAHFFSLAIMCLLMMAVNNAWDLATWLAHPARKVRRRMKSKKKT